MLLTSINNPEASVAYDPEYYRRYYQANKEKKRRQAKEWEARNPEKMRESRRRQSARRRSLGLDVEARKKWEANNRPYILWNAARQRAKKSGVAFEIIRDDVVIPDVCPILGLKIDVLERGRMNPCSPSLDRIDPVKGYVPGNVWVISWQANRMKSDASPEELKLFCEGMLAVLSKQETQTVQGWLGRKPGA